MRAARVTSRYDAAPIVVIAGARSYGPRPLADTALRSDDIYHDVQTEDTLPKVAYRYFGDARLWWVVADFNDLRDPFVPLVEGTTLRLPSRTRLWMEVLR